MHNGPQLIAPTAVADGAVPGGRHHHRHCVAAHLLCRPAMHSHLRAMPLLLLDVRLIEFVIVPSDCTRCWAGTLRWPGPRVSVATCLPTTKSPFPSHVAHPSGDENRATIPASSHASSAIWNTNRPGGHPQQSFHHATIPVLGPPASTPFFVVVVIRNSLLSQRPYCPLCDDGMPGPGRRRPPGPIMGHRRRCHCSHPRSPVPRLRLSSSLRLTCCKSDLVPSLSPISPPCRNRVQPPAHCYLEAAWAVDSGH
jgi:hypothetical protein